MTNDIAIRYCDEYLARHIADIDKEFLKKAKEALQQQPCDDCISRVYIEPIIEELENICVNGDEHILNLLADIKNAPSVTPQESEASE